MEKKKLSERYRDDDRDRELQRKAPGKPTNEPVQVQEPTILVKRVQAQEELIERQRELQKDRFTTWPVYCDEINQVASDKSILAEDVEYQKDRVAREYYKSLNNDIKRLVKERPGCVWQGHFERLKWLKDTNIQKRYPAFVPILDDIYKIAKWNDRLKALADKEKVALIKTGERNWPLSYFETSAGMYQQVAKDINCSAAFVKKVTRFMIGIGGYKLVRIYGQGGNKRFIYSDGYYIIDNNDVRSKKITFLTSKESKQIKEFKT